MRWPVVCLLLCACPAWPLPPGFDPPGTTDPDTGDLGPTGSPPRTTTPGERPAEGRWTTLPYELVHDPIGAALLHGPIAAEDEARPTSPLGQVFILSGSGDDPANQVMLSTVLDLRAQTLTDHVVPFDAFCAGLVHLSDGDVFVAGGNIYDPEDSPGQELGLPDAAIYDVETERYEVQPDMAHGRWYPTTTLLPDGRVMTDSGWDLLAMNSTVEIFTEGVGWSPEYPMGWTPMFYPRQHVLPDGRVFNGAPETESRVFDPADVGPYASGWTHVAWTNYGKDPNQYNREYGSSVLLGLYPDDGYRPEVMIFGGNRLNPTASTERIDLSAPDPQWELGPDMVQPRVRMNAALLPDGQILVLGGSFVDYATTAAVLDAELYDPVTDRFSPAGRLAYPRMDHSEVLLLPDGRLWVAGNQGPPGPIMTYETRMEIYEPPYLFAEDGSLAERPLVTRVPAEVGWGEAFAVTIEAPEVAQVVLMRPGAVTHSFDTDQRLIGLEFHAGEGDTYTLVAPPDANVAPPGYYMLFALDDAGVPSVADFVRLR